LLNLWIRDMRTGETRQLTRLSTSAMSPAWSPDGARIAFLDVDAIWRRAAVAVEGRPEWVFVKLHCHGMNPDDREAMLGGLMQDFLRALTQESRAEGLGLHFVTAREMVNIILAACDGREGNPGDYRDYRLRLITPQRSA